MPVLTIEIARKPQYLLYRRSKGHSVPFSLTIANPEVSEVLN